MRKIDKGKAGKMLAGMLLLGGGLGLLQNANRRKQVEK